MLKDGEKGVILQRDKESYAIAPHLACGIVTPEILERYAAVARKYEIPCMKLTSACRFAFLGIKEEQVDPIWEELESGLGHAVGLCVRSVKVCPGTQFCRLAKQDSMAMGMKLDETYHGMKVPSKMKMAVSGCRIQCAENCIKDISLYGTDKGWTVLVGGNGGINPRLADVLVEDASTQEAEEIIEKIVLYCKDSGNRSRLGRVIDKVGLDTLRQEILGG
ncbi:MAG: NAD(P)/FAD-dependent oxidoreductase [Desulfofustis sp.]|nr:NAD(P)/FAD-dependent oxidoreductase [Desulfofustis sp.]MBT8344705.1 NAD(P)/FAD-dependent oxidoreductase [Desulfofustis sp.]MBT8353773.1 NAD(P)/FAD-dependent oxidoreductase [Desulfofustis sp.]NNK13604.1 NAD(P)/FAD-dependent oxidoreductase [Desulfofustis sp.]